MRGKGVCAVMCASEVESALSERDNTRKGRDTLPEIISEHATSTVLPALLVTPLALPFTLSRLLDRDLERNAKRHVLTRSCPSPSPICLQADLSALYLYQAIYQPPPSPPTPLLDQRGSISSYTGSQLTPHTFWSVSAGYDTMQLPFPLTGSAGLAR